MRTLVHFIVKICFQAAQINVYLFLARFSFHFTFVVVIIIFCLGLSNNVVLHFVAAARLSLGQKHALSAISCCCCCCCLLVMLMLLLHCVVVVFFW